MLWGHSPTVFLSLAVGTNDQIRSAGFDGVLRLQTDFETPEPTLSAPDLSGTLSHVKRPLTSPAKETELSVSDRYSHPAQGKSPAS